MVRQKRTEGRALSEYRTAARKMAQAPPFPYISGNISQLVNGVLRVGDPMPV
jgi:hypothetical protein